MIFFLKKKIAATMHSLVELHINIIGDQHYNSGKIGGVTVFKHYHKTHKTCQFARYELNLIYTQELSTITPKSQ